MNPSKDEVKHQFLKDFGVVNETNDRSYAEMLGVSVGLDCSRLKSW